MLLRQSVTKSVKSTLFVPICLYTIDPCAGFVFVCGRTRYIYTKSKKKTPLHQYLQNISIYSHLTVYWLCVCGRVSNKDMVSSKLGILNQILSTSKGSLMIQVADFQMNQHNFQITRVKRSLLARFQVYNSWVLLVESMVLKVHMTKVNYSWTKHPAQIGMLKWKHIFTFWLTIYLPSLSFQTVNLDI